MGSPPRSLSPAPRPPPPLLLLLLSAFTTVTTAARGRSLPGRFGCLFEADLCRPFEICINDGVFGRCLQGPMIDMYRYEVTPPILEHLRTILQKLSHRGFTWQDDFTQGTVAQELANIPKIYQWHPESLASDGVNSIRTSKPKVDNKRPSTLENDIDLTKSLQQYLTYLRILTRASSPNVYPWIKNDKASVQNNIFPEHLLNYIVQKARGSTPALTYVPKSHPNYPDNPSRRTFSPIQPDTFSYNLDPDLDKQNLIAALKAYMAQNVAEENPDKGPSGRTRSSPHSSSWFLPTYNEAFSKEEESMDVKEKPLFLLKTGLRDLNPGSEKSVQKLSSVPGDAKDPLSTLDETLIQNVLKDLRKQQGTIENLSPLELQKMADVITDVMQGSNTEVPGMVGSETVGEQREQEMKRVNSPESKNYPNGLMVQDNLQDNREQESDDRVDEKVKDLDTEMAGFVNEQETQYLSEGLPSEKLFKTETKKSEDSESSLSSEEENAGVENVKSETYSQELTAEKKPYADPNANEFVEFQDWIQGTLKQDERLSEGPPKIPGEGLQLEVKSSDEEEYGYIMTEEDPLSVEKGKKLIKEVAQLLKLPPTAIVDVNVLGPAVTFKVSSSFQNMTTAEVAKATADNKEKLEKASGLKILRTGIGSKSKLNLLPHGAEQEDSTKFIVLTLISIACIIGVLLASGVLYCLRHSSHHKLKEKLSALGADSGSDATAAYQELCRQRMAVKTSDRPEPLHTSRINSVSSQFSDGPIPSPSARSSTSSWSEEPVQSNMDISTGHMILSYMEDHLKNKNRLEKEWEALCAYQAEPNSSLVAQKEENVQKNRSPAVLTYDHSRILLKSENSHDNSDYINASPIMDHDPRNPAYIATQGPLPATVADFWQMVWENGCVVIVMLTPLTENGVKQCYHYWPDEGSNLYHIYEVNLVSEHIWCEDFLVRSFYLKNLQTNETRTVTQFHFLSWYDQGVPSSTRSLLDFRRKVNKCYRGRSCPIIVHCSDGAGRSGTYVLIDMVLNKMAKGAKEIDIAATLEHLRDQRPGMVQTKEQFEFALTAVAEEVNAILKALPQ
ncbi:receptor-type tyrosine-protein phosphatase N2 isoform X1 [Monodelphis domestica]|uniref:receptor-type tyrosine-protein phosphatase N2 isoform X1 n=2 Tax=Monodelphis domestica TaxID=13616 RepID=UPI00044367AA|nr:receptor-type tyrosine-protein phosphatase N2 isoform X1 [Monodelphis domestica]